MTPHPIDPPARRPASRGDTARACVAIGLSLWALLLLAGLAVTLSPWVLGIPGGACQAPALVLAGGGGLVLLTRAPRRPGLAVGLAAAVGLIISTLSTFTHPLLILGLQVGDVLIWGAGFRLWRAHPGWLAGLVGAALLLAGGSELYLASAPARPVDPQYGATMVLHPGEVVELTLACPAGRVPRYLQFSTQVLSPGPLGLLRQGAPVVRYMGLLPGTSTILIDNCMYAEEYSLTFSVTSW